MDDAKSSPDMIEKTAVSAHAGAVLMLLMKMLNHGIQGDIHLVFDLLNAVLSDNQKTASVRLWSSTTTPRNSACS